MGKTASNDSSWCVFHIRRRAIEPSTLNKLIFGFLIGSITVIVLIADELKALQTDSIVAALPLAIVMIGMLISTVILSKKEKLWDKKK